ncbi:hypothetical protein GQ457_15G019790 [Hibiscus cannabinus]
MGHEKIQEEQRGGFATIAKNLTIAHIPESINIFLVLGLEKKSEVTRCQTLLTNRVEFQRIRKKVEVAENAGISPSLSKSTLNNSHSRPATTTCPIAKSFGTVERNQVDILIVRALCPNGIPFNVLRNPDFLAMLKGVNQAPKTTNLRHLIEREQLWLMSRQPLINVVASNSSGSMFMNAKDFTGQEKIGANIAEFLLESIEEVGSSNVLQVITDNAANWDERTKSFGREVATTIVDDEFWEEVDNILVITQPIYSMIRFADGEGEKMGEVYEKMDCMIGEIRDILLKNNKHVDDYAKMEEILVSRWEKMNITMHCLGFSLNNFFYDSKYLNVEAPGGIARRAPNQDREVVAGVLKAFDRIGEDENGKADLRKQLAKFHNNQGIFGTTHARIDATTMSPISWWSTYGSETPELAEIAIRVLSQPISSSSAERVWSTYSYIHNIKRNHLNAKRADKLVFIHSNIRLLSRFTTSYKEGPCKKWDIDPESTYFDDSIVRLEDLRWVD